jgi:hypothetical protein
MALKSKLDVVADAKKTRKSAAETAAEKQAKAEARRADVEAFNKRHEAHVAARKAKAGTAASLPAEPDDEAATKAEWAKVLLPAVPADAGVAERQAVHQAAFSELVGQVKAFGFTRKFADVAGLVLLQQIRDSKAYKNQQAVMQNGTIVPITSWEDFCINILGASKNKIDEDLQNLAAFGEDFMETAQRMGLSYRELRALRKLPEDERALIIEGEKVSTDPTAMKEFLEELVSKQAVDKDKLRKELDKKSKELETVREVSADEHKASLNLKEELIYLKSLPPDQAIILQGEKERVAIKDLHKESLMVLGAWTAYLARAVALRNLDDASPNTIESVHAYTTDICDAIAKSIQQYGLDVEFRPYAYADLQDISATDADADAETEN